ncbi:VOC family protein [Streptomyces sp. NPDC002812]|uniref:VOC family protein n=1 Tax=unclassified Streptomyces TaxID=2593676 RepID=UPI0020307B1B|nr:MULTISPECIES: VOC family protein [unclassified Streptomyces]MCM1967934.1 VOC family protein [Streptomyces sp. G1]MCX5128292.1 VOC family protein [Streptomyces sp. NBC_00347]MCX5300827.1 VOC family protein [Streptomyces sp. NBC_00193]
MAKEIQVTYDCADPGAQAAFWAQALGYRVQLPSDGSADWAAISDPDGKGPRLYFQRVPEARTEAKNRLHLDVRSAPGLKGDERMAVLEVEAARLEELGAKRLYRLESDEENEGIIVMTDPEENIFCLD